MADKEKDAPLDKAKVAGGVYQNEDGKGFHNANGDPVDEAGDLLEVEAAPEPVEETDDWKDEMEAQKAASEEGTPTPKRGRRRRGGG